MFQRERREREKAVNHLRILYMIYEYTQNSKYKEEHIKKNLHKKNERKVDNNVYLARK